MCDRVWSFWYANHKTYFVLQDVIMLNIIRSGKDVPCGTWIPVVRAGLLLMMYLVPG